MPPASKKHCSVIIYDLACKNQQDYEIQLKKLLFLKWNIRTVDRCILIAMNGDRTRNKFDYKGICVLNEPDMYMDPQKMLENVPNKVADDEDRSSWLEALHVACELIDEEYDADGVITKQLAIFSDFSVDLKDYSLSRRVLNGINENEISFYCFGPSIKPNRVLKTPKDVDLWMNDSEALNSLPEGRNFQLLKVLIGKTKKRVICDLELCVNMFCTYINSHESQNWLQPLKISEAIKIPCQTVRVLNNGKLNIKFRCRNKKIQKYCNALNPDEIYEYFDIIKCVKRHDRLIPIRDAKRFQVENERAFSLVNFTDKEQVPELYLRGDGSYVVKAVHKFMSALIKVCHDENLYGIAKRVYNKNNKPKYYALIPNVSEEGNYFIMCMLPFAQGMKREVKEMPVESAEKVNIDFEVTSFLDSLEEKVMPTMMYAPSMHRFAEYSLEMEYGLAHKDDPFKIEVPDDLPLIKKWENLVVV